LVAAAAIEADQSSEVIAGLSSYLLMATNRSLGEGSLGKCSQLTLHATHGKAVFVDSGDSFLVVLFDQFAEIGPALAGIDAAAARIRLASQLG
jgi:predicted regulator of Ras-like GTPase activity (Roadblock/LC7/MglB family)